MANSHDGNAQVLSYPQHPPKDFSDLAVTLIKNGLGGVDAETLERHLEQVGYFRLKGYWHPFLSPSSSCDHKHVLPFREGTQFQQIWCRYIFDQELRTLVFDGIITFEIYLKSFLAHELSLFGGEFGYTTPEGLPELSFDDYLACINSLRASFTKSNLPYLKHFKRTYKDPLPPYWMILGCLSYGTLKGYFYQGSPDSVKRKLAAKLQFLTQILIPQYMETSRFSQIGWKRLGKSATWLHIMIVSGTRPVPISFQSCLSIGAVRTPMNGGATIGTLSERTLPAPPLSSPWKTTCCNKSMAPHGRTNSSASWTAIRKFLQRKWDSPRIGDHSHCGHDDRRAPSVVPRPLDHDL